MKEKGMSVIKNAEIITMGKEKKDCNSIAIENGKIKSIGHFSEMSGYLDSNTKIYDTSGMTVLPGFTDSHVHLFMTGLRAQQMELKDTRSFKDILDKILDWDKNHPGDDWICGWGVDDTKLKENRLPTAKDLNKASTKRPVWLLRFDGNASILNTEGIKKVKFNTDHISALRDENGDFTGIFLVPLNWDIRSQVLMNVGRDTLTDAAKWTADFACSNGITSLHPM